MYKIKYLISNILYKILNIELLLKLRSDLIKTELSKKISLGKDSKLFDSTEIYNFKNDPNDISIGKNTYLKGELLIFPYANRIEIGDFCYVGENSKIWCGENVKIGNNVLISHNVNIMDTNSHEINYLERRKGFLKIITEGHSKDKGNVLTDSITIEDDVWIGLNSIILKGVTLGKGAIVSAGSVVTKSVEPFTMVAGNPAVIIKKISE